MAGLNSTIVATNPSVYYRFKFDELYKFSPYIYNEFGDNPVRTVIGINSEYNNSTYYKVGHTKIDQIPPTNPQTVPTFFADPEIEYGSDSTLIKHVQSSSSYSKSNRTLTQVGYYIASWTPLDPPACQPEIDGYTNAILNFGRLHVVTERYGSHSISINGNHTITNATCGNVRIDYTIVFDLDSIFTTTGHTILDHSIYGRHGHCLKHGINFQSRTRGLVEREPTENYSMAMAPHVPIYIGEQVSNVNTFARVPVFDHAGTFDGRYYRIPMTFEFIYEKSGDVSSIPLEFPNTGNVSSQLVIRSDISEIEHFIHLMNGTTLQSTYAQYRIIHTETVGTGFQTVYNLPVHVIVSYQFEVDIDDLVIRETTKVQHNGKLVTTQAITSISQGDADNINNSNNKVTLRATMLNSFLAANGLHSSSGRLRMDTFSIAPVYLSNSDMASRYAKSFLYENIITNSNPTYYIKFNDKKSIISNSLEVQIGSPSFTENYINPSTTREEPGPETINDSRSFLFNKGDYVYARNYSGVSSLFTSTNWSVEFWFKTTETDSRVLFQSTADVRNEFPGITVLINSRAGSAISGRLQAIYSTNQHIDTLELDGNSNAYNFNDGQWHHVCFIKDDSDLMLYMDGVSHGTQHVDQKSISQNQLMFMFSRNDMQTCVGNMSNFAIYSRALNENEIFARNLYKPEYFFSGSTVISGNPIQSGLKIYNHFTGELINTIETDSLGNFNVPLFDNREIDIISTSIIGGDIIRKIHGPITPAESA